jgi:hypothetical protein
MSQHRHAKARRRIVVAALTAVGLAGASVIAAGSAQAAGLNLLPTTTTLTSSNYAPLTPATPITLTASVKAAPLGGLIITPSGSVDFIVTSSDGFGADQLLGSAKVKACLLTACTASITIADSVLPVGYDEITASYGGDLLTKSSSGATFLGSGVSRGIDFSYSVTCLASQPCHTGSVTSLDGSTAASIDAPPQPYDYIIELGVGPEPLPCSTTGGGETADWGLFRDTGDGTASFTGIKTVTYLAFDSSATAGLAWTSPHVCFESDNDFVGSYPVSPPFQNIPPTPGSYAHGLVPFDSGEGEYVGLLDTCASNGNVVPCIVSDTSVTPPAGHTVEQKIVVSTSAQDPRITN